MVYRYKTLHSICPTFENIRFLAPITNFNSSCTLRKEQIFISGMPLTCKNKLKIMFNHRLNFIAYYAQVLHAT